MAINAKNDNNEKVCNKIKTMILYANSNILKKQT